MPRALKAQTVLAAVAAALLLSNPAMSHAQSTPAQPTAKPPAAAPARTTPPTASPSKAETDRAGLLMHAPSPNVAGFVGDPYPLDVCIVSGEKLGADAVTVTLKDMADFMQEGRQMKFCCKDCQAKFMANPGEYVRKLDSEIIQQQSASYPIKHCLVMIEEKLGDDAKPLVFGNRLYMFCCKKCIVNFSKNSGRYESAYEKELIAKQKPTYPLDTCVVSGEKLGDKAYDFVIGHQLVRTCCDDCAKKVLNNPAPSLAKIDAAAKTSGSDKKSK